MHDLCDCVNVCVSGWMCYTVCFGHESRWAEYKKEKNIPRHNIRMLRTRSSDIT